MSKRESGLVALFALGMLLMLTPSPASAQLCAFECDCTSSCSQVCTTGPDIPDCPECNQSTCGDWGTCINSWGCTPGGECPALACTSTIDGGSSGDTLNGNSAHECINGNGGDDTLTGNAGDDTIHGGDGNDTIYGNSGNDCLYGDAGDDNLNGGSGTDLCEGETESSCEL